VETIRDYSVSDPEGPLFKASKDALGRQMIAPTTPGENLAATVGVGIGKVFLFQVETAQVDALLAILEQQFTASQSAPFYSAERHLNFVPHIRPWAIGG